MARHPLKRRPCTGQATRAIPSEESSPVSPALRPFIEALADLIVADLMREERDGNDDEGDDDARGDLREA